MDIVNVFVVCCTGDKMDVDKICFLLSFLDLNIMKRTQRELSVEEGGEEGGDD